MVEAAPKFASAPADRSAALADFFRDHIHVVYSAALRQTGGRHHDAQDLTQQVFALAARNARRLARHPCPLAWLHLVVRNLARNHHRAERRRAALAERVSNEPTHTNPDALTDWQRLSPLLDDTLAALSQADREAILLRFFAKKSFADIARHLGLGENSARMRTERALEKLRRALARRGVRSTAAALALAFGEHALVAAPDPLVRLALAQTLPTATVAHLGMVPLLSLFMHTSKWLIPLLTFAAGITTGLMLPAAGPSPTPASPAQNTAAVATEVAARRREPPAPYQTPTSAPPTSSNSAPDTPLLQEPSIDTLARFKRINFPTLADDLSLTPEAITLLRLTPQEVRSVVQLWRQAKDDLDRLVGSQIEVESQSDSSAVLNVPAIPEAISIRDTLQSRLREILGEQRTQVFSQNSEFTERQVMLGFGQAPVKIELTWLPDGKINIEETHRYSSMAMAYDELPKRFENVILRRR